MQRLSQKKRGTKFSAVPKHSGTYPFHPGNIATAQGELDKVPAYNSAGREYDRILPPLRNQKIIDTRLLALLINKKTIGNIAEQTQDGIRLNQVEIKLSEGLANTKDMKFRFLDLYELLMNLMQEGLLIASVQDLRTIKYHYYKEVTENENF